MLVFLQTLLMLRAALMDWLFWRIRGVVSPTEKDLEEDDQATAEYDDERGVVFYPPVYAQRYAAVSDLLQDPRWAGRLEKVVDLGYHDTSFIKYLKEVPGVRTILGVDLEFTPVADNLFRCEDYAAKREDPLTLVLFQGNAADPDYRLIGCDAVVSIEMVEHMLPHDLERLVHTVFGFIKPWVAIFTTPNADFNVLFKSMLANGFRNWDHKFEWTREQFNDWCANIVCRYPQFEVYSHGVGPGPPDTAHLGCCTQLALFVNNDYQKRHDLTPDALSIVTKIHHSHHSIHEDAEDGEPKDFSNCNLQQSSIAVLDIPKSSLSVFIPESTVAIKEIQKNLSSDKPAQCNIDIERAKEYLMTCDDESGPKTLSADRSVRPKVYNIEDISCRLNCSTVQVKRFSEKSSMLMANIKPELHLRTEEVIGELKHLTRMLNLSRRSRGADRGETVWKNINWGDDAPYWNQYYTVVKEYMYPCQTKSESERMLDLLSDEIHRIVDQVDEDEWRLEQGRLHIELERLMPVVRHITVDVNAVRDLLDWNGYEVQNECVVYSRPAFDEDPNAEEWRATQDTDVEWDFDETQSTVFEEPVSPDYSEDRVRRAIDRKVQCLRSVLNERDITSELSAVVDKLSSLALRNTDEQGKRQRWMQYKLYDLLSLSEKAIQRRGPSSAESANAEAYFDPLLHIKLSLSTICTQKTLKNKVLPSFYQESVPLDFEETLNDNVTASQSGMFTDSTLCPDNSNSPNFGNSVPDSPIQSHEKLDRNMYTKVSKSISHMHLKNRKGRNNDAKNLSMERPMTKLKGSVQCCHMSTEKRRKGHKRKFRKFKDLLDQKASNDLESYEPMINLSEKEITSAASKEMDVFDLSTEEADPLTNAKQDFYSSFFVADNKVYQCDMHQSTGYKSEENDYCEPSTSSGIRHTSANIQCGNTPPVPYNNNVSTSISQYSVNMFTCASNAPTQSFDAAVGTQPEANRRSNLRCCGINLHSYNEKRKNNEVLYHGQWQQKVQAKSKIHSCKAVENSRILPGRLIQVDAKTLKIGQKNRNNNTKPGISENGKLTKNYITPSSNNSSLSGTSERDAKNSSISKVTSNKNSVKNMTKESENLTKQKGEKTKNIPNQSFSSKSTSSHFNSIRNTDKIKRNITSPKKYSKVIPKNTTNKMKITSDNMRTKKINSIFKNVKDIPSKIAVQKLAKGFTLVAKKDIMEAGCSNFTNQKSETEISSHLKENKIDTHMGESYPNLKNDESVQYTKSIGNSGGNDLINHQNPIEQCFSGLSTDNNASFENSEVQVSDSVSFGENVNSDRQIASQERLISNHTSDLMPIPEEGILPVWLLNVSNNQPSEPDGIADAVVAAGGGRGEVAGAGDGRGVHLTSSFSDYSSSILSTDASLSSGAFQSMNVDGAARTDSVAIEDLPMQPSSSSSTTAANTRVRVNGRTRARAGNRTAPDQDSLSGIDGDISS